VKIDPATEQEEEKAEREAEEEAEKLEAVE